MRASGSPTRAAGAKAYFQKDEPVHLFGLTVPAVRTLARSLHREVKPFWTVADAIAFADLAVKKREFEAKWLGFFVLNRYADEFPEELATRIKGWITGGHCGNWALIDALSADVIAPFLQRHPKQLPAITAWHKSPNRWLRRASVVPLVPFARRGEHLAVSYSTARALFSDDEDLTHKATGWLLREAGKTNPRRLNAFLVAHGPDIPRTTLRYAIEHFPPSERARLLEETKRPAAVPAPEPEAVEQA